jgi:hypothetical protein
MTERVMTVAGTTVGSAIKAALARAEFHRSSSSRRLHVRLMTQWGDDCSGLTINAHITVRNNQELAAQEGKGVRRIPWDELDVRADELVCLVDEAVAEVEIAVQSAPVPLPRPSRSEDDFEIDSFDGLIQETYRTITQASSALLKTDHARRLSANAVCEATMCGALNLAALAAYAGGFGPDDVQDALKGAISEIRAKAPVDSRILTAKRLDA